jgi:hypothetical protein
MTTIQQSPTPTTEQPAIHRLSWLPGLRTLLGYKATANHSLEWSAADDSRLRTKSRLGDGEAAIARYTAWSIWSNSPKAPP